MLARLNLAQVSRSPRDAAIGVDVGGTKIAFGLLDAEWLTLLAKHVIPTGRERSGEEILRDTESQVQALAKESVRLGRRTIGIGVAVPEIVSPAGRITSSAVIPCWDELPVTETLGAIAPAVIEADVRASAFAEASLGAGRHYGYHVFLTVGTGISYCAVSGGRPFTGSRGGALNVGTSVLAVIPGTPGEAGREVVLERIASGAALVRRYTELGGIAQRAEDVLAAAEEGDGRAETVLADGARALGIGIALLVNLLDPEAVVIGGGLGSADTAYGGAAQRWARHYFHRFAAGTPLLHGQLGPEAGVIGAALAGLQAPGLTATG
jgi:glucokinase